MPIYNLHDADLIVKKSYRPVTAEEHEQKRTCLNCGNKQTCKLVQAYSVCWVDEVLARPDPLALLEAWITKELYMYESLPKGRTIHMIQLLRTNPDAVRQQGIDEGWYL